jgi:hypothetical protein
MDPAFGQNPQRTKPHPALISDFQMRLNMTSSIPVDKPPCFPDPVPRFCELFPPFFWVKGKEVQPAIFRAPLYQNSFRAFLGRRGLPGSRIMDPAFGRNPQRTKPHPALISAFQMRLNMTSSILVDKPLCFPGPVPRFCELFPPFLEVREKEVQPAPFRASLYQNSFRQVQGLPGGVLRSRHP